MYPLHFSSILLFAFLLPTGCNDADHVVKQDGFTTVVFGESVIIENNHGQPISYFAVEYETAQLISWAARSGKENTIAHRSSKVILWEDIMSDGSLQRGDRVVVYWWVAPREESVPSAMMQNVIVL